MGNNMSKKITFDGQFPRFDENGEFSTDIETNLVHRFYLDNDELVDRYPGKTDEEIIEIEHAAHLEMVAELQAQEEAIRAERQAGQ